MNQDIAPRVGQKVTIFTNEQLAEHDSKVAAKAIRMVATHYRNTEGLGLEPDAVFWWDWFADALDAEADGFEVNPNLLDYVEVSAGAAPAATQNSDPEWSDPEPWQHYVTGKRRGFGSSRKADYDYKPRSREEYDAQTQNGDPK